MNIGFIGLGKMGQGMVARLINGRHDVVAYDVDPAAVRRARSMGAHTARDRADLIAQLGKRPVVWVMIPSAFVDTEIKALLEILPSGSIIIDGGNSDYRKTLQRHSRCLEKGVELVDVGTSGGVLGVHQGFSMMVGGENEAVRYVEPLIKSLAQPQGYRHFGPTGAGHYIKMVHNAIEYGIMESYAEGFELLREGPFKRLDLAAIAEVWQHGSIIASNLNGVAGDVFAKYPSLSHTDGVVPQTGETTWALEVAEESDIELPGIRAAVGVREASVKGRVTFATKLLTALRHAFGGHALRNK